MPNEDATNEANANANLPQTEQAVIDRERWQQYTDAAALLVGNTGLLELDTNGRFDAIARDFADLFASMVQSGMLQTLVTGFGPSATAAAKDAATGALVGLVIMAVLFGTTLTVQAIQRQKAREELAAQIAMQHGQIGREWGKWYLKYAADAERSPSSLFIKVSKLEAKAKKKRAARDAAKNATKRANLQAELEKILARASALAAVMAEVAAGLQPWTADDVLEGGGDGGTRPGGGRPGSDDFAIPGTGPKGGGSGGLLPWQVSDVNDANNEEKREEGSGGVWLLALLAAAFLGAA